MPPPQNTFSTLKSLVLFHQDMRPLMTAQDVYKMLYQSVFGIGHILNNPQHARHYLEDEVDALSIDPADDLLIEPISHTTTMVRVNLRPFDLMLGDYDKFFDVMIESALKTTGSIAEFCVLWDSYVELVKSGHLLFNLPELAALHIDVKQAAYPVMHHSPIYRRHYSPAYRVVKKEIFETAFLMTL
ncbi:hypothetical protein JW960_17555 [candidate division KSB1 bacterium]|nr:hypothetical protein [candidate division KSB1 bacterium]